MASLYLIITVVGSLRIIIISNLLKGFNKQKKKSFKKIPKKFQKIPGRVPGSKIFPTELRALKFVVRVPGFLLKCSGNRNPALAHPCLHILECIHRVRSNEFGRRIGKIFLLRKIFETLASGGISDWLSCTSCYVALSKF